MMDRSGRDLYPDDGHERNQPGLEVDSYHLTPKAGWAAESTVAGDYSTYTGPQRTERKTILGLSVLVFWGLVVLLVVLLAGGIGGGVGAGLASRKASCSNANINGSAPATVTLQPTACITSGSSGSSNTATATGSAATSSVSPAPSSQCSDPNVNGTTITPIDSGGDSIKSNNAVQAFRILCNTNWPSGPNYGNPDLKDLLKVWTPDLTSCITLCAEYNAALSNNGGKSGFCQGISMVVKAGEFCYLKSGTGLNDTATSGDVPYVSAQLL